MKKSATNNIFNLNQNFRSCYRVIGLVITVPCTSTTTGTPFTTVAGLLGFATGRKRREAENEIVTQNPISKIGEQKMLSYRDYIDATKVSPSNKYCLAQ